MDKIWVTQKYIESPLIIKQRKFDIRQWVIVTAWRPKLQVWHWMEPYLRFTSDNYDPNQLHNKYANLTNATLNKENNPGDENDGDLSIIGNMWHGNQFETYLQSLAKSCLPGSDACSQYENPFR
jgi:tubulin monoglycylase TTLL3/8